MFRGVNAVNMDVKGRITLPTRYRVRLQEENAKEMVMTIDTDERCLLLYPLDDWEAIEQKLAKLPSFNPAARRIQRLLMGHASDIELDKNGRILVPPLLREYAGLKKQVILIGQGRKCELWDESHWQDRRTFWLEEAQGTDTQSLPDDVKGLSL